MSELDAFLLHLQVNRGAAATTLNRWRGPARDYLASADVRVVEPPAIVAYVTRRCEGLSANSVNTHVAVIRAVHRWMLETGQRLDNPSTAIPRRRASSRIPVPPSPGDVARVLEAMHGPSLDDRRAHLCAHLLYGCGLRIGEARALTVDAIDLETAQLVVRRGKGDRDRVVPMSPIVVALVRRWLAARPSRSRVLLAGADGACMGRTRFAARLAAAAASAGAAGDWHPHALRHAFATHLMSRGVSARIIQRMLGHASLEMTERYMQVVVSDLHHAMTSHPLASDTSVPAGRPLPGRSTIAARVSLQVA